jgi:hypothetical protein
MSDPGAGHRRKSMVEYGVADLIEGLEALYDALDPETADSQTVAWARSSVDALLKGERVRAPQREKRPPR